MRTDLDLTEQAHASNLCQTGRVTLVGAGPGDPGLLTLHAVEALREADVVLYDYLVNPAVFKHCRPGVRTEFVGKQSGHHSCSQQDINQRLIKLALDGCIVVRLKGGDPFVFGRGGEELAELSQAGIQCRVIPGVTAGIAAPSAAGIPITHRGLAGSVCFITGHRREDATDHDWAALAAIDTLVCYMAVGSMDRIATALIAAGRGPQTPVAIIRWGTWATQETHATTLANAAITIAEHTIAPPAIIVIGEVVALACIAHQPPPD